MEEVKPFAFMDCAKVLKSTGRKAAGLRDLREIITQISEQSLFHHVCGYFLKGHELEYTNDFAEWAGESLEESILSEYLSNIDPFEYKTLNELRGALIVCIDTYLSKFPEPRSVLPGNEFYFNETVSIVFPAGIQSRNLAEFLIAVKLIDGGSIYYHFYEARIRHGIDDFSRWIQDTMGKEALVNELRMIDPFMHTIEGIRRHIVESVDHALQIEMENTGL